MTEEQIKQNAERYASENYHPYGSETNPQYLIVSEDSFIAGAHSRDEEIEKLEKQLAAMTRLKNSFAGGVDILDKDNRELQEELDKLHNPWISVEKRLPERENDKAS